MTGQTRIAILQTGRAPEPLRAEHGDYDMMCAALIGRAPDEVDSFAVLDGALPADIAPYDAFVITGSAHGVYEGHRWIAPLEALVRAAFAANKKLVGICFGHQILAQALGGTVEKSDAGLGAGRMAYDYIDERGAARQIALHAWHQDQVTQAPPGTEIIAASAFCPVAALRYGDRAISFQAHPEFSAAYMAGLIGARRGVSFSDDAAREALASLGGAVDAEAIGARLRRFLER